MSNEFIIRDDHDFWVKVVGMLQQNWALISPEHADSVRVDFITDASGIFDSLSYATKDEAIIALRRNGFVRYADDTEMQSFISLPKPPFQIGSHPNGKIYSSGRFWKL